MQADLGRKEDAISSLREALANGIVKAAKDLGDLMGALGRNEEAEAFYQQAIEAAVPDARINYAHLLGEMGKSAQARSQIEEAIREGDDSACKDLEQLPDK